jgi:hypothetical protein
MIFFFDKSCSKRGNPMLNCNLLLFTLFLGFMVISAYAFADEALLVQQQMAPNSQSGFNGDPPPNVPAAPANTGNNVNVDAVPCGLSGQGPCSQPGYGGTNTISGIPNSGMPNDQKTQPCGIGGQGPCSQPGPGGIDPISGLPYEQKPVPAANAAHPAAGVK